MKDQQSTNLWAIIPSKNRLKSLEKLVRRLTNDNVRVIVIDTGYPAGSDLRVNSTKVHIFDGSETLNISTWWNKGLRYADKTTKGEYFVAILNDDVEVPKNFVQKLVEAMETDKTVAAFPDVHNVGPGILTRQEPTSVFHRMQGYAFCLRGSARILADEDFVWWCGDDDIDWKARGLGGVSRVAGLTVKHLDPNGWSVTNPELHEQTAKDMQHFVDKWGKRPW